MIISENDSGISPSHSLLLKVVVTMEFRNYVPGIKEREEVNFRKRGAS
jgi:hypothetical protein